MYNRVKKYTFFDGVDKHQVINSYDNWLSSCEYPVYTKSYINLDGIQINLFGSKTKKTDKFFVQNKELFNELNQKLNFEIKEKESNNYTIYDNKKKYEDYYVAYSEFNDKNYIVFYSLGGSRFVESINIYGVFISDKQTSAPC